MDRKPGYKRGAIGQVNLDVLDDILEGVQWPEGLLPDHPEARRLLEALGVVGLPEAPPMTTAARGMAAMVFRESRARAFRRRDANEKVLTCVECGTETDVDEVAHSPRCSQRAGATPDTAAVAAKPMEKGRNGWLQSGNERAPDGSLTIGEMNRRHDAVIDAKTTATGCAWCSWTFTGTAVDGRLAAANHRATDHPDRAAKKKSRPRVGTQFPARIEEPSPPEDALMADTETAQPDGLAALEAMDRGEPQNPLPAPEAPPPPGIAHWTLETAIAAVQAFARRHGRPPKAKESGPRQGLPSIPLPPSLGLGLRWAALIEAAGFPRPTRGGGPGPNRSVRAPQAPEKPVTASPARTVAARPVAVAVSEESPRPVAAEPRARAVDPATPVVVGQQEVALSEPGIPLDDGRPAGAPPVDSGPGSLSADLEITEVTEIVREALPARIEFSLALTGDFARDAHRVRAEARKLRAQAVALDVIAEGLDQLAAAAAAA